MKRNKKIILIIVLLLFLGGIFISYQQYHFFSTKKALYQSGLLLELERAYNEFIDDKQGELITDLPGHFLKYLSNQEKYEDLHFLLINTSFNIKAHSENSIILYDYGFNQKDDRLEKTYSPFEVSFLESFYKKGDVILKEIELNSKAPEIIFPSDTIGVPMPNINEEE